MKLILTLSILLFPAAGFAEGSCEDFFLGLFRATKRASGLGSRQREGELNVRAIGQSWPNFDRYENFDYGGRKRVLFLSDGGKSAHLFGKEKGTLFVSTDFVPRKKQQVRLDNNLLPFKSGSFDTIIMNRGLCPCHSLTHTCGGLRVAKPEIRAFLGEVSRVLNPEAPDSLAVMTGFYFPPPFGKIVPEMFSSQLDELRGAFPQLEYTLLIDPTIEASGGFIGLAIHRKGASPGDILRRLMSGK